MRASGVSRRFACGFRSDVYCADEIPKENAHLVKLEWTEDKQAKLKALVEQYTSRGSSGAWRVHRWRLACISLLLGDTDDSNEIPGPWQNEWTLKPWVDSPIFRWLRQTFLPMLINEPAEYPKPDKDDPLSEALRPEQMTPENALPSVPPPEEVVLFCPLPDQVHHLKWWLMKYFADHVDIFHMYVEIGYNEQTEM
jgi:hypothetical protein